MKKVLALVLALPLAACTVGDGNTTPPGGDDTGSGSDPGGSGSDPGGGGLSVAGHITTSATWSGVVTVTAAATIDPGVTITVDAGTEIDVAPTASISVAGTFLVNGTSTSEVNIKSTATGGHFSSFQVQSGGTLTYTFVKHVGGGINFPSGATGNTATITDSNLSNANGDLLVMSSGTLVMDYSQIGIGTPDNPSGAGSGDTTHCNYHINSVASLTVTHSNIAGSPFGFMLYAKNTDGTVTNLQNNNFYGNQQDFESGEATQQVGDVTGSYFAAGMPASGTGALGSNLATAPLAVGPGAAR